MPTDTRPYAQRVREDYALVTGRIASAPTDLARLFDQVIRTLRARGWTPVVKHMGTDFEGPLGIPIPRDQPVELWLHRADRAYQPAEAQAALTQATREAGLNYSPLSAYAGELVQHVVVPSIQDAKALGKTGASLIPWIVAGLAIVYLAPLLPRGRR